MLFSFLRRVRRTICFFIGAAALVLLLKYEFPEVGKQIGSWISGLENTRVAQAFSSMLNNLSDGDGFFDSIEVFHDSLQTEASD